MFLREKTAHQQSRIAHLGHLSIVIARRTRITTTHTFAILEVTTATLSEIEGKLRAAEYDHCFSKDDDDGATLIDMTGIALKASG